ncbi:MAG: acetyl-CoA C-acyltransferase [Bacteroidetes bacterium]|nr:acetyl-CoA C-acyltransferase [Bacteroidota bacterium]MBS1975773.1 acetyl-CoA C-acyltransferase [Bacteroidota bacterium]
MKSAFITDIIRTPIGKYGGTLSSVRPDDLVASTIRELLNRNSTLSGAAVEDVIVGAANQSGEDNRNVARMALLLAGLPVSVGGVTVNRLCASGLQAIMTAALGINTGNGEVYIAAGVESMSRAPFVMAKSEEPFGRKAEVYDTTLGWRFVNKQLAKLYHPYSMGETAENVAEKWKISREEQDRFGLASQLKYFTAEKAGKFNDERIQIQIVKGKEKTAFAVDEYPRETTLEKLAALKPAFRENGSVTAGNSSGINDGAAASLVVSEEAARQFNLHPMVRIVSTAVAGVDPAYMGVGPVQATRKALQRTGLRISDLGLVELNEAFASQAIACIHDLDLNPELVNVNGGAIALGHPLGCSGVRISATLIHEMMRRKVKFGLATMCIGVGQGAAIVYENLNA